MLLQRGGIPVSQRVVNTRFWEDNYVYNLDPTQKLIFLYLLTNSHANIAGVYELNERKAANETGIDREMILKIIDKFMQDGKVYYADGYVILRNFIRHQSLNPKIMIGIQKIIETLPENVRKLYAITNDGLYLDAREMPGKNGGKTLLLTDKLNKMWLNSYENAQNEKKYRTK